MLIVLLALMLFAVVSLVRYLAALLKMIPKSNKDFDAFSSKPAKPGSDK